MKKRGSRLIEVVVFLLTVAGSLRPCTAAILINFDAGPGNLQTGQAVLGFSPDDVWNNVNSDTNTALVDSNNNPLADVAFTRTGTPYNGSGIGATTPDMDPATTNLMEDWLWTNPGNASTAPVIWTLTGLSAYAGDAFTLVIYAAGDTADRGGSSSTLTLAADNGGDSASTSGTSRRISDGPGVAYVELSGTVDAAGQVQFSQTSPNFTAFNGAQILIVPEPATWVMLIGGAGILNFWQRFRRLGM